MGIAEPFSPLVSVKVVAVGVVVVVVVDATETEEEAELRAPGGFGTIGIAPARADPTKGAPRGGEVMPSALTTSTVERGRANWSLRIVFVSPTVSVVSGVADCDCDCSCGCGASAPSSIVTISLMLCWLISCSCCCSRRGEHVSGGGEGGGSKGGGRERSVTLDATERGGEWQECWSTDAALGSGPRESAREGDNNKDDDDGGGGAGEDGRGNGGDEGLRVNAPGEPPGSGTKQVGDNDEGDDDDEDEGDDAGGEEGGEEGSCERD